MDRIEKYKAKIAYLEEKKEMLTGKQRSWCRYQITCAKNTLEHLNKLKQWRVI